MKKSRLSYQAGNQLFNGEITASNFDGSYNVNVLGRPFPFKHVACEGEYKFREGDRVLLAYKDADRQKPFIFGYASQITTSTEGDMIDLTAIPMNFYLGNKGRTCWCNGQAFPFLPAGTGEVYYEFPAGEEAGLFDGQYIYGNKALYEFPIVKKVRDCPTIYTDLNSQANYADTSSNIIYNIQDKKRRRIRTSSTEISLIYDDYINDTINKITHNMANEIPSGFTLQTIRTIESEDQPAYAIFQKNYTTPPPRPVFVDQQLAYSIKKWNSQKSGYFPYPIISGKAVQKYVFDFPSAGYTRTRSTPKGYCFKDGFYIEQIERVVGSGAGTGLTYVEHRRLFSRDGNSWDQIGTDFFIEAGSPTLTTFHPNANWVSELTKPFSSFANEKIWIKRVGTELATGTYSYSIDFLENHDSFFERELGNADYTAEISNNKYRLMIEPQGGAPVSYLIYNSTIKYRLQNWAYQNIEGKEDAILDFSDIISGINWTIDRNNSLLTDDHILYFVFQDNVNFKIGVIGFDITKPEDGVIYFYEQDVNEVEGVRLFPERQKLYCYGQYLAFNAGDAWKIIY